VPGDSGDARHHRAPPQRSQLGSPRARHDCRPRLRCRRPAGARRFSVERITRNALVAPAVPAAGSFLGFIPGADREPLRGRRWSLTSRSTRV